MRSPAYHTAAAKHIDIDGRPGFISQRRFWGPESDSCRVRIYEEPAHGEFTCVCVMDFVYPLMAGRCVAAGDVDGDSIDEIAISSGADVRLLGVSRSVRGNRFGSGTTAQSRGFGSATSIRTAGTR